MELFAQMEAFATQLGASPWLLVLVLVLTVVDGVLPPVPSETVLITAAVLAMTADGPHLALVVAAAATGALVGDLLAFAVGRHLPLHRLPWLRGERGRRAWARAGAALDRRGTTMVITGRFIPVGRVAINMSAGALGFPARRFTVAAGAAGLLWASYNALIAIGAQSLTGGSPLVSVALGVLTGALTGIAVEAVLRRVRLTPAAPDASTEGSTPVPGRDPAQRTPVGAASRWLL